MRPGSQQSAAESEQIEKLENPVSKSETDSNQKKNPEVC
jgi:hypothetical protein